jgi:hypothetical protein
MTAYFQSTAALPLFFLKPGDRVAVWSAETPLTGSASMAVGLDPGRLEGDQRLNVQLNFASDPGTFTCDLQTSDTEDPNDYVTEVGAQLTAANLNAGKTSARLAGGGWNVKARFARLLMTLQSSNSIAQTGTISR